VIQVDINDLKTIALFPEQRVQIVSNCIAHIQAIVANARASGMRVILTTIIPAGNIPLERRPYWSDDINNAILEVNTALQRMARSDVFVLETASLVADANGIVKPEYQRDFLHLNQAGYQQLTPKLMEMLALSNGGYNLPVAITATASHVKRGDRVVHGEKELSEKLGRNDLCPCGSGRRF
jgi:lysophospholipase L1-like esterase